MSHDPTITQFFDSLEPLKARILEERARERAKLSAPQKIEPGYYWAIEMETADIPLSAVWEIIWANPDKGLAFRIGADFPLPLKEFAIQQRVEKKPTPDSKERVYQTPEQAY